MRGMSWVFSQYRIPALFCTDPVKLCSCYKEDLVAMSVTMAEGFKRWTAKRKSELVVEILRGKTTVAEAARAYRCRHVCSQAAPNKSFNIKLSTIIENSGITR